MRIVVDPGHGGGDKGATVNGCTESVLTFSLAQALHGFDKVITRQKDENPFKAVRAKRAVDAKADAAIILHFNAGRLDSQPEIYYDGSDDGWPTFWGAVPPNILPLPDIYGLQVKTFETSRHTKSPDLAWLSRAHSCLSPYTIPTILLEVGYLTDKRVAEYIITQGLMRTAIQISTWIQARIKMMESKKP